MSPSPKNPHRGQPVLMAGVPLDETPFAAMVMVHGRGASAQSILSSLVPVLNQPGFAYVAPQAANYTWYPYGFMRPIESNEPGISSGLWVIDDLLTRIVNRGVPLERIMLLGFSQGACLTLEYTARHARRYGGVAGLSGGLIGPDGTSRDYEGSLEDTPVFLGCSDVDFHIPKERVKQSAEVLEQLGGEVKVRLYTGMGHTINQDEINVVREMMGHLIRKRA